MSIASDRGDQPDTLSPLGRRMQELREQVFDTWMRRVRAEVAGAESLLRPVLVNTMPALYDNLTEAVTPGYPRTSAAVATPSVALEHGSERARLTRYEIQSIIVEYQLLRDTIYAVLGEHAVPVDEGEKQVIDSAIDASIREAVTSFALVQSAFREQFFAALAHDLRGPLSNASIAAQLIGRTDDIDTIRRHACKIQSNIARVDEMIKQMLDALIFQHGERLKLKLSQFDLQEIVTDVCEHMTLAHGPRFVVQGGSVQGWWGRAELQRALENLITNAVKYGASGTRIRILLSSDYGRAILSVHNEGNPIPPEQVESVFQVFRRALDAKKGDAQGWGIGLPYVRSVAESHGGSIDVDSAPERGTTFTVDIPLDARPFQDTPVL